MSTPGAAVLPGHEHRHKPDIDIATPHDGHVSARGAAATVRDRSRAWRTSAAATLIQPARRSRRATALSLMPGCAARRARAALAISCHDGWEARCFGGDVSAGAWPASRPAWLKATSRGAGRPVVGLGALPPTTLRIWASAPWSRSAWHERRGSPLPLAPGLAVRRASAVPATFPRGRSPLRRVEPLVSREFCAVRRPSARPLRGHASIPGPC